MKTLRVAAVQLNSTLSAHENLQTLKHLLAPLKSQGVQAVFLPEVYLSMSNGREATVDFVSEGNELHQAIRKLAIESQLFLIGGSVATRDPQISEKLLNRSYNFSPEGDELGRYDKMHLFACDLSQHSSGQVIDEGFLYQAGKKPLLIDVLGWKVGISICFDLRFPELFRYYSFKGAEILSVSSAFTVPTGKAHWHTLLRARAIENQCYVVAAAQWGQHNERISTFGHSLIVDPWGEILQDAQEGVRVVVTDLSEDRIKQIRSRLNVLRDPRRVL